MEVTFCLISDELRLTSRYVKGPDEAANVHDEHAETILGSIAESLYGVRR